MTGNTNQNDPKQVLKKAETTFRSDRPEAVRMAKVALELARTQQDLVTVSRALCLLADAERLGGKLDRAMEYIQRALELDPDNGAYVDTLGWAESRLPGGMMSPQHTKPHRQVLGNYDTATGERILPPDHAERIRQSAEMQARQKRWETVRTLYPELRRLRRLSRL